MCQCNSKDQTPKEVVDFLNEKGIDVFSEKTQGIGMFIIPAPDLGIMETRVMLVDNLSYKECAKRGNTCEGFKWIPKGYSFTHGSERKLVTISSMEDLKNASFNCNNACRGGCPMGCHCYSGWTWCQPNNYA